MSVYMPKINYILLIYRNLFLASIHTSKLLLLNSLMELLGTNTDIHKIKNNPLWQQKHFKKYLRKSHR